MAVEIYYYPADFNWNRILVAFNRIKNYYFFSLIFKYFVKEVDF